jgi:hypothetical protein
VLGGQEDGKGAPEADDWRLTCWVAVMGVEKVGRKAGSFRMKLFSFH